VAVRVTRDDWAIREEVAVQREADADDASRGLVRTRCFRSAVDVT
jgi:hypothetical protein